MRPLVVSASILLVALALVPATTASPVPPLPCSATDLGHCHVTVTEPGRCPEAGYYDSTTVGPVTVRTLHCTSGVPE